ncbi:MAG: ferredoxin [Gemmatimonadetes bacterium]|nr:ferredoxin [Gemmatimonadota bacterium]
MNAKPNARLRIEVDHLCCVGNAMCLALAPGVFAHNGSRQSVVHDPKGGSREDILDAAENCPTGAISVSDADTGETLFP